MSRGRRVIRNPDNPNKNNPAPIGTVNIAISYGPVAADPASKARKSSLDLDEIVGTGAL